jgi:hypothetical protein
MPSTKSALLVIGKGLMITIPKALIPPEFEEKNLREKNGRWFILGPNERVLFVDKTCACGRVLMCTFNNGAVRGTQLQKKVCYFCKEEKRKFNRL